MRTVTLPLLACVFSLCLLATSPSAAQPVAPCSDAHCNAALQCNPSDPYACAPTSTSPAHGGCSPAPFPSAACAAADQCDESSCSKNNCSMPCNVTSCTAGQACGAQPYFCWRGSSYGGCAQHKNAFMTWPDEARCRGCCDLSACASLTTAAPTPAPTPVPTPAPTPEPTSTTTSTTETSTTSLTTTSTTTDTNTSSTTSSLTSTSTTTTMTALPTTSSVEPSTTAAPIVSTTASSAATTATTATTSAPPEMISVSCALCDFSACYSKQNHLSADAAACGVSDNNTSSGDNATVTSDVFVCLAARDGNGQGIKAGSCGPSAQAIGVADAGRAVPLSTAVCTSCCYCELTYSAATQRRVQLARGASGSSVAVSALAMSAAGAAGMFSAAQSVAVGFLVCSLNSMRAVSMSSLYVLAPIAAIATDGGSKNLPDESFLSLAEFACLTNVILVAAFVALHYIMHRAAVCCFCFAPTHSSITGLAMETGAHATQQTSVGTLFWPNASLLLIVLLQQGTVLFATIALAESDNKGAVTYVIAALGMIVGLVPIAVCLYAAAAYFARNNDNDDGNGGESALLLRERRWVEAADAEASVLANLGGARMRHDYRHVNVSMSARDADDDTMSPMAKDAPAASAAAAAAAAAPKKEQSQEKRQQQETGGGGSHVFSAPRSSKRSLYHETSDYLLEDRSQPRLSSAQPRGVAGGNGGSAAGGDGCCGCSPAEDTSVSGSNCAARLLSAGTTWVPRRLVRAHGSLFASYRMAAVRFFHAFLVSTNFVTGVVVGCYRGVSECRWQVIALLVLVALQLLGLLIFRPFRLRWLNLALIVINVTRVAELSSLLVSDASAAVRDDFDDATVVKDVALAIFNGLCLLQAVAEWWRWRREMARIRGATVTSVGSMSVYDLA